MKYLAWYIFVIVIIQILYSIGTKEYSGQDRVMRVLARIPMAIFFLFYLHII